MPVLISNLGAVFLCVPSRQTVPSNMSFGGLPMILVLNHVHVPQGADTA